MSWLLWLRCSWVTFKSEWPRNARQFPVLLVVLRKPSWFEERTRPRCIRAVCLRNRQSVVRCRSHSGTLNIHTSGSLRSFSSLGHTPTQVGLRGLLRAAWLCWREVLMNYCCLGWLCFAVEIDLLWGLSQLCCCLRFHEWLVLLSSIVGLNSAGTVWCRHFGRERPLQPEGQRNYRGESSVFFFKMWKSLGKKRCGDVVFLLLQEEESIEQLCVDGCVVVGTGDA